MAKSAENLRGHLNGTQCESKKDWVKNDIVCNGDSQTCLDVKSYINDILIAIGNYF